MSIRSAVLNAPLEATHQQPRTTRTPDLAGLAPLLANLVQGWRCDINANMIFDAPTFSFQPLYPRSHVGDVYA